MGELPRKEQEEEDKGCEWVGKEWKVGTGPVKGERLFECRKEGAAGCSPTHERGDCADDRADPCIGDGEPLHWGVNRCVKQKIADAENSGGAVTSKVENSSAKDGADSCK